MYHMLWDLCWQKTSNLYCAGFARIFIVLICDCRTFSPVEIQPPLNCLVWLYNFFFFAVWWKVWTFALVTEQITEGHMYCEDLNVSIYFQTTEYMQSHITHKAEIIFMQLIWRLWIIMLVLYLSHSLYYWRAEHLLPPHLYLSPISQADSHDLVGGGKGGKKFQSFCSTLPARLPTDTSISSSNVSWQEVIMDYGRGTTLMSQNMN